MRRSSFFGRDADLTRLATLLADHRLVTVTGAGGVGKTRLVEEARPFLREVYGDEVLFVSLADVDRQADPAVISAELGMHSPEALAMSHRDGSALLVLDNCEHLAGVAAEFVARLLDAGDAVSVVATSRVPLGIPDEQLLVLDPLGLPAPDDAEPLGSPSAALFVERAAAVGGRWDRTDEAVAAVCEICRRVDGLPLAIELAAARTRALSPVEILSLMERRLDALHVPGPGRPARHSSVRAAIDVSIDALDDEAAEFLDRVSVFAGAFDLHLAHAVAGPRPDDRLHTIDLVSQLVDASLLVAEPVADQTRYRLLELVREYCIESLHDAGAWESTNERLTDVMVAEGDRLLGLAAASWSGNVVRQLGDRFHDFGQAVRWCIEQDTDAARAQRLFIALYAGIHLSRSAEVRALGEQVLARWPDTEAPLRGEVLAVMATAHTMASRYDAGVALASAALATPGVTALGRVIAHRTAMLAAMSTGDLTSARTRRQRTGGSPISRCGAVRARAARIRGCHSRPGRLPRAKRPQPRPTRSRRRPRRTIRSPRSGRDWWRRSSPCERRSSTKRAPNSRRRGAARCRRRISGGAALSFGLRAISQHWTAAAVTRWEASRSTWRVAIERAAGLGDVGELALALQAAATVAARAGRADVAGALLDAMPRDDRDDRVAITIRRTDARSSDPSSTDGTVVSLRRALDALDDTEPRRSVDERNDLVASLRRDGDVWLISYKGNSVRLRDLKGLHDLAVLFERTGQEIHCLELMGAAHVQESTGAVLDSRARKEYQDRIIDLQTEIDDARAANDPARAERAEVELDALVQQLSEAFGIAGRARGRGSSAERARTAVTYRIRATVKRIADIHPELARHLDNAVRTGTWCSYRPDAEVAWAVQRT